MDFPSISVVIPTLNAEKSLKRCLKSLVEQEYPKDKIELIVVDGGSTDATLRVAKLYKAKIRPNPLRTGEAGKAVGVKSATGELVAFIDSDNILPHHDWLQRMVEPLKDPRIVGSEPWRYSWRAFDGFITRYCALIGMNDPMVLFLGNYDRMSMLTGRWTDLPIRQRDRGNWIDVILEGSSIPTIGANGTILRRRILDNEIKEADYLFDIDMLATLASRHPVHFAKVKVGIVHIYCGSSVTTFIRKQRRRVLDYLYYRKIGVRTYPWQEHNKRGVIQFTFACLTVIPLFYQVIKGYMRKPDAAWFFHPLACWLTFVIYVTGTVRAMFKVVEMVRTDWSQS